MCSLLARVSVRDTVGALVLESPTSFSFCRVRSSILTALTRELDTLRARDPDLARTLAPIPPPPAAAKSSDANVDAVLAAVSNVWLPSSKE